MTVPGTRRIPTLQRWLVGAILLFLAAFQIAAPVKAAPFSVSITSPKDGDSVAKGDVSMFAMTSDSSPSVFFKIIPDPKIGTPFTLNATQVTLNTWKITWNASVAPAGSYSVTATAADPVGGEATSMPVNFTLTGGGPTVALNAPTAGASLSGNAGLSATVSAAVSSLQFVMTHGDFAPTVIEGVADGAGTTYTASWDTTKAPNDAYTVYAKAFYGAGSTAVSPTVGVTVSNAEALSVSVLSPAPGATWSGIKDFSATTNVIAASVGFRVKSGETVVATLPGSSSDGKNWSVSWDTTKVPNGFYSVDAKATTADAKTAMATVAFGINNGAPFSVVAEYPTGGETLSGSPSITAKTSSAAASVSFAIKSGATTVWTVEGTSGDQKAWAAIFDTTKVPNGIYAVEIKAMNGSGGTATANVPNVTVSNAAPFSVAFASPAPGETVSGTKTLSAITSANATSAQFFVKKDGSTVATLNGTTSDSKTWTVNWDTTSVPNATYNIDVKALQSTIAAGANVSGIVVSNAVPVTVILSSPSPGVTLDATASFVATVSPASDSLTFAIRSATASQASTPIDVVNASSSNAGASWNGTWDTKKVANGEYKVTAVAVKDGKPTAGTPVAFKILNVVAQEPPPENQEPLSVVTTSPSAGASLVGETVFSATANQPVDSLQFVVSGAPNGPIVLSASGNETKTVWTANFDTASVPNGDYAVAAKAFKGQASASSATKTFKVANVSISISFTAPANGATVSGVTGVALAAIPKATAVTVRISKVLDPTQASERVATYDPALQVWKASWNTADFPNQKYRLDATASDDLGKKYFASAITVTVSNAAPANVAEDFTAKIISPKDGGFIYGNVPLAVIVTGEAVAAKFFITPEAGGNIVSVDGHYDAVAKAWVGTWNSTSTPNGPIKIGAVAYNAKNAKAESLPVNATLSNKVAQPPDAPPAAALSVTLTSPGDGVVGDQTLFVAVAEGTPTSVGFVLKRQGTTALPIVIPAHYDTLAKTWIASWDSLKAEVGTYIAVAHAKDASGAQADSNAVTLYVERQVAAAPAPEPPATELAVRIIRPLDGAIEHGSAVIAARTDASATRVTFVGRDAAGAQVFVLVGTYSRDLGAWAAYLDTTTLKDGKYGLSAAATDAAGKRVVTSSSFSVANAAAVGAAVESVEVIPVEAVREAAKLPPPGTTPLAIERIEPPPVDVAEKLYKECADAGIIPSRCEEWLATQRRTDECHDAGIVTKEECVAYLEKLHGVVPGCEGNDAAACAEAVIRGTAGLGSADELDRASKAIEKHVGKHLFVPREDDSAEKEDPSLDDVLAYVTIGRRDGINLKVHASPAFVRTDDDSSHRSVPAVLFVDTDGDGLPDDAEVRLGTKPDVADTDGDGFPDGEEVKNGYNPLGKGRLTDGVKLAPVDVAIVSGVPMEQPNSAGKETADLVVQTAEQKENEEVLHLSGKARPGETVTLFVYSYLPVVLTTVADANGEWSYDLGATLDDGQHEVYVAVTDDTGKIKEKGSPLSFFVASAQAASADEFFKSEPVEDSPTLAAIQDEPVRQSFLPYVVATGLLLVVAGIIAFMLLRPKRNDGAPPA